MQTAADGPDDVPCTWRDASECGDCDLGGRLMCRFDAGDLAGFALHFMPLGTAAVAGMIRGGYGWWVFAWIAYCGLFFFVWEARVLCRHCPYWAEESRVLHCPANYGVVKIWAYVPGPMTRSERIQFLAGGLLLACIPLAFLLAGRQYLLAAVAVLSAASAVYNVRRHVCTRCINFSCPGNAVPEALVDAYLERNPCMREVWLACGYGTGSLHAPSEGRPDT